MLFCALQSRGRNNSFAAMQEASPMSVVAFAPRPHPTANQPKKDLYKVGEIPPLGHVPKSMYAWAIRRDRHGPPEQSMQLQDGPTHPIGGDGGLGRGMAAGGYRNRGGG